MSLIKAKSMLIKELLETKEYIYLKQTKDRLDKNSEYKTRTVEFEKKTDIFRLKRNNNEDTKELFDEIEEEYVNLTSIKEINDYFQAVRAMNNLVSGIFDDIQLTINVNLL